MVKKKQLSEVQGEVIVDTYKKTILNELILNKKSKINKKQKISS